MKTAETGYMQRRLMKALEDLSLKYATWQLKMHPPENERMAAEKGPFQKKDSLPVPSFFRGELLNFGSVYLGGGFNICFIITRKLGEMIHNIFQTG